MNDYATTMNKAEILIKLAEVERRGREFGRREADKNLLNVTGCWIFQCGSTRNYWKS